MKKFLRQTAVMTLVLSMMLTVAVIPVSAQEVTDFVANPQTVTAVTGSGIDAEPAVDTGAAIVVTEAEASGKSSNRSVKLTISHEHDNGLITGYEIYKKNSDGKWVKKADVEKTTKTTYTDSSVSYKKTYSYRVRAYYRDAEGKTHYGKYTDTIKVNVSLNVASAKIASLIPGKTSVKLALSHGKGRISGYEVYKKDKNGKWVRKALVKKTGKASYEDDKVSYKGTYSYKARVYYRDSRGKTYYGRFSKSVKVKVTIHQEKKYVSDKNSALYGKTLLIYKFGDGTTVTDPEKYTKIKADKYELYVSKSRDYVTAYAVSGKYLVPVKAFICSPGVATPVGTHNIILKYRWHELMGPCWGQWCSKVTNDGIYFHSIFSSQPNSNSTMSVRAYNKLGTTCSHGCIRVQAGAAKWIYDHCDVGTKVVIHNKSGYEPFSKPVIGKLPAWHTWDPTDPTAVKYCKEHKCH